MDKDVKDRIDAIRQSLSIKHYYKTEIGTFPCDWKVAKLSDIAEKLTQAAGTDSYETVSISAGTGFVNQAEKFGKELSGKQYEKYIVLHKGDFSYNKGNSNKYPQGCIYRLKDRETAAVPNVFENFRIQSGCAEFYDHLFVSGFLNQQLSRKINHGVRDDGLLNLTEQDFYSCLLPFPPLAEQEKISEILDHYDKLINLCEAKVDEYKNLKKICLNKMFPQNGSGVPELRFPGFIDAWEQRKLKDICSIFTDGDWIESKDQSDQGVRLIQTGNVGVTEYLDKPNNKKWVSEDTFKRLHCTEVLNGDILISRLPEPAGRACIVPKIGEKMITAVDCTIARIAPEYRSEYVVQYLSTQDYFEEVNSCLAGGTRQRISRGNLSNFLIPLPCSKAEQERIGGFFHSLDNLITLHQRKLEEQMKMKKALEQLLLKGIVRVKI